MTPAEFIAKWQPVTLNERAAVQEHFVDLCRLLELPTPIEGDPTGDTYRFEKRVSKAAGGKGYADVWRQGCFGWEYKSPGKDLNAAYIQLLLYRDDLDNPPLLVVSDIQRILVHTNFTDTTKKVYEIALEDLAKPDTRQLLKQVFTDPNSLNPKSHREAITAEATGRIGEIAIRLQDRGHDPEHVAHFMMQLVFALFAEDIRLLPNRVVSEILEKTGTNPDVAHRYLSELFTAMAEGGFAAMQEIPYFNGGLFQGGEVLRLEAEELRILHRAAELDWSEVEPAIFGTLFERSLDPNKRSQLGAHYTSRDDILRIVQPVIMEPLWQEWDAIRTTAKEHIEAPEHDHAPTASRLRRERVDEPITEYLHKLQTLSVLDPACGSGNFLYIAMQQLKDLEKDVVTFAQGVGAPGYMTVGPKQFYGLEINVFARELTSMVIWIGYLQWNRANDVSNQQRPILEKLGNIKLHDALMNDDGTEYEWPEADFIIGNPPFLGNHKMRTELGNEYTEGLYELFGDRIPNKSDLVCYWFEKARACIAEGPTSRAGLIATNSIRGGANNRVLDRIVEDVGIFVAWSDEPWILEGAAVRVSIVGFGEHTSSVGVLNGELTPRINSDLTKGLDFSEMRRLQANAQISFEGVKPVGPFYLDNKTAVQWLDLVNPSGADNRNVLRPFFQGRDITVGPSNRWIVDFFPLTKDEASEYTVPFDHVLQNVKPTRAGNRKDYRRDYWWRLGEDQPSMREAIRGLHRFLVTPRHMKHRAFAWVPANVLPGDALTIIASDEDYMFGVLHSQIHTRWAYRQGTSIGMGNDSRYTPTTCFETFPFPRPADERYDVVAKWGRHLSAIRDQILDSHSDLTLTKLYNEIDELREERDSTHRAYPVLVAHEKLDEAVAAAYGWEWPLEEEEILKRLLTLNLERAAEEQDRENE